jgi:hypothetical protein
MLRIDTVRGLALLVLIVALVMACRPPSSGMDVVTFVQLPFDAKLRDFVDNPPPVCGHGHRLPAPPAGCPNLPQDHIELGKISPDVRIVLTHLDTLWDPTSPAQATACMQWYAY